VQLALLGDGDAALEARAVDERTARCPGRVGSFIGYDESLARLVQAALDCAARCPRASSRAG
jgi:starch synthase